MATIPVVTIQDDLASLVKASLQHHEIPVTAAFDVFGQTPHDRFIAISTPISETKGLRQAYLSVFEALDTETFAPRSFLRLHTLVLSSDEANEVRRSLRKGASEAAIPRLAHLDDVRVRAAEDASRIEKNGILQIGNLDNGSYLLKFVGMDGLQKRRRIGSSAELKKVLAALGVQLATTAFECAPSVSVAINCTLEALYREGLV